MPLYNPHKTISVLLLLLVIQYINSQTLKSSQDFVGSPEFVFLIVIAGLFVLSFIVIIGIHVIVTIRVTYFMSEKPNDVELVSRAKKPTSASDSNGISKPVDGVNVQVNKEKLFDDNKPNNNKEASNDEHKVLDSPFKNAHVEKDLSSSSSSSVKKRAEQKSSENKSSEKKSSKKASANAEKVKENLSSSSSSASSSEKKSLEKKSSEKSSSKTGSDSNNNDT